MRVVTLHEVFPSRQDPGLCIREVDLIGVFGPGLWRLRFFAARLLSLLPLGLTLFGLGLILGLCLSVPLSRAGFDLGLRRFDRRQPSLPAL